MFNRVPNPSPKYSSSSAAFSQVLLSGKLLSSKLLSGLQIRGVGGLLHREPHKLDLQERDQIRGHPLQHQHRGIQHRLAQRGVWAMIAVFLAYSLLQAPSTVFIRPHPAIWRLVHGMAVVYLVALTFLLFQNRDDARQFMKYLHPALGVELPERSYGAGCRIYVPENPKNRFFNVYNTLFDEFVLAHIFGWWGKAIMIRNQPLLWVLSIGFELMEFTFRHMLPNFNECWWDSIILDILICNWFAETLVTLLLPANGCENNYFSNG
ncbi:CDP-diacylglycerol--serine O-phosphatidyltransferase 1-like [Zingiber officinale]|uniref:CDP-diacylglycerol--serine O-phosphatidyltransferase 1-like n=1 Tax=Zingiber officinale TaxID=94328 RepID=UPI001C4B6180|nr:CDP-diacylglycerol--serine O-phosphatidyltransferase 1-like [Zingiber officinale]